MFNIMPQKSELCNDKIHYGNVRHNLCHMKQTNVALLVKKTVIMKEELQ